MPTVLITGASSGIGADAASTLARRGWGVYGTSRKAPASPIPGMEWLPMDVCDAPSVSKGVEEVLSRCGRLDALVCNAGMGVFGSVEELPEASALRQFDVNFHGTLRCLRATLPHMREAGGGRIALIGSLAGRAAIPFQAHYSATKAAVDSLAMALHNEVRPFGIHVSLIEPGDIDTPFNAAMTWWDGADSPYEAMMRRTEARIREELPRAPGPEQVSRVIVHALEARRPRARYTAGAASRLVPMLRRMLPDWLALRLIRSHFDLD
jgi:NAD(P)-dependent dehydrogenase (short-subunit alcohol dehydrogenase family)